MSARTRFLLILPAMLIASWLAIRSPAANTTLNPDDLDDPPASLVTAGGSSPDDPALAALIDRFADQARAADGARR